MTIMKRVLLIPVSFAFLFLLFFALRAEATITMTSPFEGTVARAVEQARADGEAKTGAGGRILGGIAPHHGLALSMMVRFYERIASHSD